MANITDGEYNNLVTWQITILPADVQIAGSIAVALFILFLNILVFAAAYVAKKWMANPYHSLIISRLLVILGIYITILNLGIIISISSDSGLNIINDLMIYFFLLRMAGYLSILFVMVKSMIDYASFKKEERMSKRMGGDY